jgi:hypothetical protein
VLDRQRPHIGSIAAVNDHSADSLADDSVTIFGLDKPELPRRLNQAGQVVAK